MSNSPGIPARVFEFSVDTNANVLHNESLERWCVDRSGATSRYRMGGIFVETNPSQGGNISIPLVGSEQLYYRRDTEKIQVSSDPRRLGSPNDSVDANGFLSLLQFGALVPPLSLNSSIRRMIPGRRYQLESGAKGIRNIGPSRVYKEAAKITLDRVDFLSELIDSILVEACPDRNPLILFSGGVDSGVLAARAAAMGWKDTLLLNYAMGEDDPESLHAEAVANTLGLPFRRVLRDVSFGDEFLQGVYATYKQPFCDFSCIPTSEIAIAAIDASGRRRTILDGTGADGAFGLFGKAKGWRKVYRTPQAIRSAAHNLYDGLGMWKRNSRVEYVMRLLARASDSTPAAAAIAQSSAKGSLVHPDADVSSANSFIGDWLGEILPRQQDGVLLGALDMSLVCSDRYAQKNKAIFDSAGEKVVYPFLHDKIVELALTTVSSWPDAEFPKQTLKEILSRCLPDSQVQRPKSGFAPPIRQYLARTSFVAAYDRLLDSDNGLTKQLNMPRFKALRAYLVQSAPLPVTTVSVLWTAIIVNEWMNQSN